MNYPANTAVVTLSRPTMIDGETLTELSVREPTVRDKIMFEKATGGIQEKELSMISSLCNMSGPQALYALSAWDYEQLVKAFNTFLLPPAERLSAGSSETSQA